jgi:hypothetical protein
MKDPRHLRPLALALAAVALLSDCGGGGYGSSGSSTTNYSVGGRVDGLDTSTSVVLKNASNNDSVTVSANGSFVFQTQLTYTAPYDVQVQTNPTGRTCIVLNGSGTVPFANVTNVVVACTSDTSAPAAGNLVITEVMANPAGASDTGKEWFEVTNSTGGPLDLGGVLVTRGSNQFVIPAGSSIPSGAFFIFAGNSSAAANGGLPHVDVDYGAALQLVDSSFDLSLRAAGILVDAVSFTTAMPDGSSRELKSTNLTATDNDNEANWCTSTTAYGAGGNGTPGAANDC